jgi:DNA-binding PadR family transcriptional regulator
VQQIALAFIARFPETTEHQVFAEVAARRPYIGWAETYVALRKLHRSGLITDEPGRGDPARRYQATNRGRQIARLIPVEPASVISFNI